MADSGRSVPSRHGCPPSAAFTLIEVLVVVAIIALLIAVLMPSLARARANARASVCASNLHQFGLALQMYDSENRGYIPRGGTHVSQHWVMLVARQIGDKRKYAHVEQVPVERYPIYSCPERVRTLPNPFIDYVINTMPSDLRHGETREVDAPTRASVWKYPGRIVLLGDAAFEAGYASHQEGASTDPELRQSRENHERAMQWVLGTPFDAVTQGSLSRMDFYHPKHLPSQPSRRGGVKTHMRTFANWLHADMHYERIVGLSGAHTCKDWLRMAGILDRNLSCY